MSEDILVFADSAGETTDPNNQVVVLSSLVLTKDQLDDATQRMNKLKLEVGKESIPINNPKFEFHTYEIYRGLGIWESMKRERRIKVLHSIKKAFPKDPLFAIVRLSKNKSAIESNQRLKKDIKELTIKTKNQLSEETIAELEAATSHLNSNN